jgi:hypothetical protein
MYFSHIQIPVWESIFTNFINSHHNEVILYLSVKQKHVLTTSEITSSQRKEKI